jgi:23S rRNA pseudouridine1911/1915/1917 synthase
MNNSEIQEINEDELFEHFKFEVPKGQLLLRVDKYLMGMLPKRRYFGQYFC